MMSLRARLLAVLLAMFVFAWVVVALLAYFRAFHEIEEVYDAGLSQSVQTLLTLAEDYALGPADPLVLADHRDRMGLYAEQDDKFNQLFIIGDEVVGHRYETKIAFQIWYDGKLRVRSLTAPEIPMASGVGYSDQSFGNKTWRVFGYRDPVDGIVAYVGEQRDLRKELAEYFTLDTMTPLILALPALAALLWLGVRNGLLPLQRFADDVANRKAEDTRLLDASKAPTEVRSVAMSINVLLSRVTRAFERERRFTADAAHELRTPLASLKTQAQVALRSKDEEIRNTALHQIVTGVDRATRLVEQMLTLARLEPHATEIIFEDVNLTEIAKEVVAEMDTQANAKHIDLGVVSECGISTVVRANRMAIGIMVRNLVDNAVRYTPTGGTIDVHLRNVNGRCELTVADTGPGIPEIDRERVMDRFYRGQSSVFAPGCGLGLSIVQQIAELHHAKVELGDSPEGTGLVVKVSFESRRAR